MYTKTFYDIFLASEREKEVSKVNLSVLFEERVEMNVSGCYDTKRGDMNPPNLLLAHFLWDSCCTSKWNVEA